MSKVDVIIPCHGYGRFLTQCVTSVLNQSVRDLRVLIIDDASFDETAGIAAGLARKDGRVNWRRHPTNRGHIATYNEGLEWASAEYTLILSADDWILPDALSRATQLLDAHPDAGFAHGSFLEVCDGEPPPAELNAPAAPGWTIMSGAEFIRVNRYGNPVATCTAVVRTARQKSIGGYRPELPHSGDMEMWMRFAAHGPVARVKAYQGVYRRHARNMSNAYYGNNILQDLRQRKAAIDLVFDNDGNRMEHAEDLRRYLYEGLAEAAVCYADKHFNQVDLKRFDEMLEFAARIRTEAARVAEIVRKDAELNALRKEVGRLVEQLTGLTAMHMTLLRSTSWRLTAPLRNFGTALPWLRTPLRRAARLAWWTVTLQAPRRLTERRSALASAAGTARGQRSAIAPAGPRPKEAPAFDRDWYPSSYPDVAAAGIDPYKHYMAHGKGEGRHPTSAAAEEANRQPRSTGGSVSN